MKKLIALNTLVIVCLACLLLMGAATPWSNAIKSKPNADWFSGASGKDIGWNWMKAADQLLVGGLGTGDIFYVDSNVTTEGDGQSWESAKDTLDEAINLCTDSNGDVIYVAQGHAETYIAADGWDADVIGITIRGFGNGSLRPTFTFNHANAEVAIGADNVTVINLRFLTTITAVAVGLDIEAGADFATIAGCEWHEVGDASGTDEFNSALRVGNACIGTMVQSCTFKAEAAGAISAIHSDNDTSYTTIRNNFFTGDYSSGCVNFITVASTDLTIIDNVIINGDMATADTSLNPVAAINCVEATSGVVVDNRIFSATATHLLMRVADDMAFSGNLTLDTADDALGGIRETLSTAIVADDDGL